MKILDFTRKNDPMQGLKSVIEYTIRDVYRNMNEVLIQRAITKAQEAIDNDGDFIAVIDAAESVMDGNVTFISGEMQPLTPDFEKRIEERRCDSERRRNVVRLLKYRNRRLMLHKIRLLVASKVICKELAGQDNKTVNAALERAERVIAGGGMARSAVYFALKTE